MHITMTKNNEKESMAQAFSCEDGLKGLKHPKNCLNQESKSSFYKFEYLGPLLLLFIKQIVIKR